MIKESARLRIRRSGLEDDLPLTEPPIKLDDSQIFVGGSEPRGQKGRAARDHAAAVGISSLQGGERMSTEESHSFGEHVVENLHGQGAYFFAAPSMNIHDSRLVTAYNSSDLCSCQRDCESNTPGKFPAGGDR
jgi:hypothetical protein